jgi:hypothetical protein
MTGADVDHFSTIMHGSRIAGTSVAGASITAISATVTLAVAALTTATRSTEATAFTGARVFMEVLTFTLSHTAADSVALITAEMHEASLRAVTRVLEAAASTAVADMAEGVTTR